MKWKPELTTDYKNHLTPKRIIDLDSYMDSLDTEQLSQINIDEINKEFCNIYI